jgi:vacuolar-type H+-ATPase subunit E/Vma4
MTGGAGRAEIAALTPVRERMLHGARAEADRILAEARSQADAIRRQARRSAEEAVERAGAQGREDTAPAAAAERSRGREQARSIVLGARRAAVEELRARVLAGALALRDEPGYERLLSGLTAIAVQAAGPDAAIAVQPAGGVEARSGGVVVDCTLPRLAGLAVDALGDQVRELWTP